MNRIILLILYILACGCAGSSKRSDPQRSGILVNTIKLPAGFHINVFTDKVKGARSMTLGVKGTLFVGTLGDKVYAVTSSNPDGAAGKVYTIAKGLNMPNGVAFRNGSLYVAELNRIIRFDGIEDRLADPPKPVVVKDELPDETTHGWKYIAFGPDGKLYVPQGMPCNVCEKDENRYGILQRMNADGSGMEVFARGIRNTVGFAWHPVSKELWFTDNGRDEMGDNLPPDELNHAPRAGMHFGFPYCHGGDIPDPEFGKIHPCSDFTPPVQKLGPHVASLGMKFYTGTQFPQEYHNQIFIAEHGSWNRSSKIGYRVSLVKLNGGKAVSYTTFADGWLQGQEVHGRPVDILNAPDGSLLISDDFNGAIYRISYK